MPVQKDDHTFLQSPVHYAPPSPGSLRLRPPCVFIHYPINSPNPFVLERGIWDFFPSSSVGYFGNKLSLRCKPWHLSVLPCWESLRMNLCLGCSLSAQRVLPHASDVMSNNSSQMSYLNPSSSALLFNPIRNSHFHLLTCSSSGSPDRGVSSKQAEAGTASLTSYCLHCAWHLADPN